MELEAGDSGIRTFVSVQGSLAMSAIHKFGSEEQKERLLPRMARGEVIGCFGLTEPTAGSDPSSMLTTATRREGGWILSGAKRWIGLASIAHVAIIWAKTDDGIRGFIVPTDTPGFVATPIEQKLSMRASIQCDITLEGVEVPDDAILPGAAGLSAPFACLNEARYGIVWGVMGAARDSLEAATDYALEREQFGRPIAGFQLTQAKLVDMLVEVQKGVLLALALGRRKDAGHAHPGTGLARQAQQHPRGDRDLPRGANGPRRQRDHARLLAVASREQPGERAHLRGHRRGAYARARPAPDGDRGVSMKRATVAALSCAVRTPFRPGLDHPSGR